MFVNAAIVKNQSVKTYSKINYMKNKANKFPKLITF